MENKFKASQLPPTPYQPLKFSIGAQCCAPAWRSKQPPNVEKGAMGTVRDRFDFLFEPAPVAPLHFAEDL